LFVGDDFVNDYLAPLELGMRPVYLDRFDKHPELESRIKSFYELQRFLGEGTVLST
jgi:FMN phosphatase YigB (HAD superfamily)